MHSVLMIGRWCNYDDNNNTNLFTRAYKSWNKNRSQDRTTRCLISCKSVWMWCLRGQDSTFSPDCFRLCLLGRSGINCLQVCLPKVVEHFTFNLHNILPARWIDRRLKRPADESVRETRTSSHLSDCLPWFLCRRRRCCCCIWRAITPMSQFGRIKSAVITSAPC